MAPPPLFAPRLAAAVLLCLRAPPAAEATAEQLAQLAEIAAARQAADKDAQATDKKEEQVSPHSHHHHHNHHTQPPTVSSAVEDTQYSTEPSTAPADRQEPLEGKDDGGLTEEGGGQDTSQPSTAPADRKDDDDPTAEAVGVPGTSTDVTVFPSLPPTSTHTHHHHHHHTHSPTAAAPAAPAPSASGEKVAVGPLEVRVDPAGDVHGGERGKLPKTKEEFAARYGAGNGAALWRGANPARSTGGSPLERTRDGFLRPQSIAVPRPPEGPPAPPVEFKLASGSHDIGAQTRAAMGKLAGMQPRTPPSDEELRRVVDAARAQQARMCATWPAESNQGCRLIGGPGAGTRVPIMPGYEASIERDLAWKIVLRDEAYHFRVLGSSSSAGHGAFFNASYAITTMKKLRPVFAEIGIEFESRNLAMGGVGYQHGTLWCVPQIAGMDADLVTWEWSMFGPDPCTLEMWLRTVAAMPRRPGTMYMQVSGPSSGGNFWGVYYYANCPGKDKEGLKKEAQDLCKEVFEKAPTVNDGKWQVPPCGYDDWDDLIRDGKCLEDWFIAMKDKNGGKGKETVSRQSDPLWQRLADLHFKIWGKTSVHSQQPTLNDPPPQDPVQYLSSNVSGQMAEYYTKHGIGVHTLNEGAVVSSVDWSPWWLYRMNLMRAMHHPGSFGHQIIAHEISYWMLNRLINAVELVQREAKKYRGVANLAGVYLRDRTAHRTKPLPPPMWCAKPGMEQPAKTSRHRCYTNYQPRMDMASSISGLVKEKTGWTVADLASDQKDDGRSYRDHKLVTSSVLKGAGGALRLAFPALPGSKTQRVDVAICGSVSAKGKGTPWAYEVSCGGAGMAERKFCWAGDGGKCDNPKIRPAGLQPLQIPFMGDGKILPRGVWRGRSVYLKKAPKKGTVAYKPSVGDECPVVCQVQSGAPFTMALRPMKATTETSTLQIRHILVMDMDSTSVDL